MGTGVPAQARVSHLALPPSFDANPNGLLPPMDFPVPRGTPLISPHIKWDHSQIWDVPAASDFPNGSGGSSAAVVYNIGEGGRGESRDGAREPAGLVVSRPGTSTKVRPPQTPAPTPPTTT